MAPMARGGNPDPCVGGDAPAGPGVSWSLNLNVTARFQRLNRWLDRHPKMIVLLSIVAFLVLIGWVVTNTVVNQRQNTRIEGLIADGADARANNRAAIISLACAVRAGHLVLEQAVLRDGTARTSDEVRRIKDFFRAFNAPVNEALNTLGAKPCQGRTR